MYLTRHPGDYEAVSGVQYSSCRAVHKIRSAVVPCCRDTQSREIAHRRNTVETVKLASSGSGKHQIESQ
jgi:hypothetical protein